MAFLICSLVFVPYGQYTLPRDRHVLLLQDDLGAIPPYAGTSYLESVTVVLPVPGLLFEDRMQN